MPRMNKGVATNVINKPRYWIYIGMNEMTTYPLFGLVTDQALLQLSSLSWLESFLPPQKGRYVCIIPGFLSK
jgi:hypothetical protein